MTRLLVNPTSGAGRGAAIAARLARFADVTVVHTTSPEHLFAEARRDASTADRLVVAGGDGTLHHAVRALAGSGCALGIVPVGTGNDLARSLGVPLDPERALRRALGREPRQVDLGRVDGVPFLSVAGAGIHGDVARRVRTGAFGGGSWAYVRAGLAAIASFSAPVVEVEYDGERFAGRATIVVVANAPFFGGGMRIAPSASIDDGWLDVVIVGHMSRLRMLLAFPSLYRGSHERHPAVRIARARSVRLTIAPATAVIADGETIVDRAREARFDIWPGSLRVVS